jgi:hypothetical protein
MIVQAKQHVQVLEGTIAPLGACCVSPGIDRASLRDPFFGLA